MNPPRPSSGASRRTQESLPVFNLYPSTITKDSKAQHILGLSRTELQSARCQSLKPQSQYPNLRNPTLDRSIERPPLAPAKIKSGPVSVDEVEVSTSPVTQHDEYESSDLTTWSQSTSLKKFPSTSTLRSFYETATSSTRDLVPAKENPNTSPAPKSSMEQPKQFRFFKTSKLRSIKENKSAIKERPYSEDQTNLIIPSRKSSFNRGPTKPHVVTNVSVIRKPSITDEVQPITNPAKNPISKYRGAEHLLHEQRSHQGTTRPTVNTPYAKINVRRPKTGTTDWFDDLDDLTSDEDEDDTVEEDFTRRFVVNEHGSFQSVQNSVQSPIESNDGQSQDQKLMQTQTTELSELPAGISEPISSPGLSRSATRRDSERSVSSQTKSNPFAQADLRQESVLHLSEGEDEHDDDDNDDNDSEDDDIKNETKDVLQPLQPVQSSDFRPALRNSLTLEPCEESEIEIGMAHTITPSARLINNRPLPIKIVDTKVMNSACSTPSTRSLRATSEPRCCSSGSIRNEEPDIKEMDEDVLLSSFPATPTSVHFPRRRSARSSASFSDDRSIVSMKMMPVTRQEENLISAMRMKRAAMKRAEKAAARGDVTNPAEQTDKMIVAASRTKQPAGIHARLSEVAMLQYGSSLKDFNQDLNRPLRSILTDSYGCRSSTAPLLSRYLAETQLYELPISPSGRDMPLISRNSSIRRHSLEQFPRPQSYLSTASADSQGRNADIIVLNNLNSGSTAQVFPAQLRMESPFVAWEKTDSAAVH